MARRDQSYFYERPVPEWAAAPRQVNWTAAPELFYETFNPDFAIAKQRFAAGEISIAKTNPNALDAYEREFERMPEGAGPYVPEMFPYGLGGRTATYVEAKANRGRPYRLKVPGKIKKTSRSAATDISAVGRRNEWPIGDLYHARLALVYALSPSHKAKRSTILKAVARHYPEYDWASWWNRERKGKKGVEPWSFYVSRSARSNPDFAVVGSALHLDQWLRANGYSREQVVRLLTAGKDENFVVHRVGMMQGLEAVGSRRRPLGQAQAGYSINIAEANPRKLSSAQLRSLYRKFHGPHWYEKSTVYARYQRGLRPMKAR